jgi:prefoldin subunit 5
MGTPIAHDFLEVERELSLLSTSLQRLAQFNQRIGAFREKASRLRTGIEELRASIATVASGQIINETRRHLEAAKGVAEQAFTRMENLIPPDHTQIRAAFDGIRQPLGALSETVPTLTQSLNNVTRVFQTLRRDVLSDTALESLADGFDEDLEGALSEVVEQMENAQSDLVTEVEDGAGTLDEQIDEIGETIEDFADSVETLIETATSTTAAVTDGTAMTQGSLETAEEIVKATQDCISQL